MPASIKHLHAHRRAVEQFLVQNLHTTSGRTGVLLFVSVAERYAQIVADKAIDAQGGAGNVENDRRSAHGSHRQRASDRRLRHGHRRHRRHAGPAFPARRRRIPNELPDHLIILQ